MYLSKRLQKLQNAAASFVTARYCRESDVLSLKWLPVKERYDLAAVKLVHKVLYDPSAPQYLKLKRFEPVRNTRSSTRLQNTLTSNEVDTFQALSTNIFNELPNSVRVINEYGKFCQNSKNHFITSSRNRLHK